MTIILNGEATETTASTVTALLRELGLAEKPVVVEHNQTALLKAEHTETSLQEGDRLEVITLAAGG
ncbi:sulfur carrier protein ThiS [Roseibacillus ishigakijimensis]|uniref:Sulfur carrier protein ThiS n=1 Tax=Roseibacillus ishigakijimensis TaxID=454146 RepID=A0A934RQA6_9BACT|nr:sulfur carrier protein ThiS [Roseibacillus ishigakijimensis]MBK1834968.1 sulfur carrier protein ThiS [Roseibacillus ishigakijimensis]